jgi:dsDNA-specific endonuclease/ATPase MutS2
MPIADWPRKLLGLLGRGAHGGPAEQAQKADELAEDDEAPAPGPVELPIDGTLDLHTFHPAEVKELLPAYLQACAARGIRNVRVVHGKGRGQLKRTVEALLARLPDVAEFHTADQSAGGWGATLVTLHLPTPGPDR